MKVKNWTIFVTPNTSNSTGKYWGASIVALLLT